MLKSVKNITLAISFITLISSFLLLFFFNFSSFVAEAAPDQELTYHGKLTDTNNIAVPDGNYQFTLNIYDETNTSIWSDVQVVTVTSGIFSTTLSNLDLLTFDQNYELGVQIGTNAEMTPRRKITPTGFALNSHRLNGLEAKETGADAHIIATNTNGDAEISGNFTVNSNNLFVNASSGDVGIGTTTLSDKLTIDSSSSSDGIQIGRSGGSLNRPHLELQKGDTGQAWSVLAGVNDNLYFKPALSDVDATDSDAVVAFTNAGRVGIGTISPSAMLDIYGANNDLRLSYDGTNYADLFVNNTGELSISASNATESAIVIGTGVAQDTSVQFDGAVHDFFVGIDNATGAYSVGTGTDVTSTATITGAGTVSNSAGGTTVTGTGTNFLSTFRVGGTITIGADTVTVTAIASDTSMTTTAIASAHSGASYTYNGGTKLAVESSGNVGIGVADPMYALDVRTTGSNAIIARFNNSSTNTSCTLSANGGTINCSSDERLKKNITPLNDGLDTLMKLKPRAYNWKFEDDEVVKTMGFIAQDVQEVLPGLVIKDEETGYLQLSTIGMIPMITQAVQEQNALITTNFNDLTQKAGITFVNEEFNTVEDEIASAQKDIIALQSDANTLATDIEAIKVRLATADAGLQILDLLGATDLVTLETLLAIDPEALLYATDGNLTLDGVFAAQKLETEKIVITGEEEDATVGLAKIEKDTKKVFVETTAANDDSRIFVTAQGDVVAQPLSVTKIKEDEGFYVGIAEAVDEDIKFDWMIVEDHVEKSDSGDEDEKKDVEDVSVKKEESVVLDTETNEDVE
ncbi:MAG: hypothetical protein CR972_01315 [Candidatus Moraniibacteriota bacterium]|nr:MAG: hypothetical protein CR972_01315 [Candidatus Moranbacteria bacterium]